MPQMPGNSQNQPPLFSSPHGRFNPGHVASAIAAYIRALIVLVFWAVTGIAAIAVGFLAVRAIWFSVNKVVTALGI